MSLLIEDKERLRREANRDQSRAYRKLHPDLVRASRRKYENNNREKVREAARIYREKNRTVLREHRRAYESAYRIKNAKRINDYQKEWKRRNRCRCLEIARNKRASMSPEQKRAFFEKPLRRYFSLTNRAKNGGLNCDISREVYFELIKSPCFYCAKSLEHEAGFSLDRIDNTKGYSLENVVPCCGDCNRIRNNILTSKEMKVAMTAVINFRTQHGGGLCGLSAGL
jgi:hypothetical protein